MCIHRSHHKDKIDQGYVGGLVSIAIHEWKPPAKQRWISKKALKSLRGNGLRKSLKEEHDPPVAFYRDQILDYKDLTAARMLKFVRGMKVTLVLAGEDLALTRATEEHGSWKSIRPPGAYDDCDPPIVRVRYPKEEDCNEHLLSKLY